LTSIGDTGHADPSGIRFRRPTEADYERIVEVIDDWWNQPRTDVLLPRLWLQHFTTTSWLAESGDGQLAGFLIGFLSPAHSEQAYAHLVATGPNRRHQGVGRALYERFFADARAGGRSEVRSVAWPANRACLRFHEALGFEVATSSATQNLYGAPGIPGYDFGREDRTILVRRLEPRATA
jgi:L-amino acid N-acyltransferase YncA